MATKTNILLWIALCVSQLIYILVVYIKTPTESPQDVSQTMFPPLLVVAVIISIGTIFYRKRALVEPIQSGSIDLSTDAGVGKGFTPFILNLVLSQSVGIYGLVLSFLSGEIQYVVGFVAASLALMYIHRPMSPQLQAPVFVGNIGNRPPPLS